MPSGDICPVPTRPALRSQTEISGRPLSCFTGKKPGCGLGHAGTVYGQDTPPWDFEAHGSGFLVPPGWKAAVGAEGYLCPSSWATVKAKGRPVSSLMLQLRWGWHMPATCDRPRVSQGLFMAMHRSFLLRQREGPLRLTWPSARPTRARGPRDRARRMPPHCSKMWSRTAAIGTQGPSFTEAPPGHAWGWGADPHGSAGAQPREQNSTWSSKTLPLNRPVAAHV